MDYGSGYKKLNGVSDTNLLDLVKNGHDNGKLSGEHEQRHPFAQRYVG